jgi:pimeloyl-ACP methyl ester carboxylesterase
MKKSALIASKIVSVLCLFLFVFALQWDKPVKILMDQYAYSDSKYIDVQGETVHYRIQGDPDKEVVVLLHGVSSSLHTWEAWQAELAKKYYVVAIDLPAFGLTGPFANGDYSTEHYMTFLEALFQKLDLKKMSIIGNSFGGYLAWEYAVFKPQQVEKLILLAPSGLDHAIEGSGKFDIGFWVVKSQVFKYLSWIFTPKVFVENSVKNVYLNDEKISADLVDRYFNLLLRQGNRQAFSGVLIAFHSRDKKALEEKLSTVKHPVLLQWGEGDNHRNVDVARLFEKKLANATLIVYPSGHVAMEESPQSTVKDALVFLDDSKKLSGANE